MSAAVFHRTSDDGMTRAWADSIARASHRPRMVLCEQNQPALCQAGARGAQLENIGPRRSFDEPDFRKLLANAVEHAAVERRSRNQFNVVAAAALPAQCWPGSPTGGIRRWKEATITLTLTP